MSGSRRTGNDGGGDEGDSGAALPAPSSPPSGREILGAVAARLMDGDGRSLSSRTEDGAPDGVRSREQSHNTLRTSLSAQSHSLSRELSNQTADAGVAREIGDAHAQHVAGHAVDAGHVPHELAVVAAAHAVSHPRAVVVEAVPSFSLRFTAGTGVRRANGRDMPKSQTGGWPNRFR